ncbi:MAG: T9SS type A sorting domain-containing protein [Ignavibacteria bacterium]|nr:T9SS type A sorting domain-containing protein [Ignavibacteria bacterium]
MRKTTILAVFLFCLVLESSFAAPKISFTELMTAAELNPSILSEVKTKCVQLNFPLEIYTNEKVIITARGIENNQIVYAVIKDIIHPFNNGETMFLNDVIANYDFNSSRLVYADGKITDNTNGMYNIVLSPKRSGGKLILVPEWTLDKVFAFDETTGDIVDTNFIPASAPMLASPKQALQTANNKIIVSDQITDAVQMFDTNGTYVRLFAPAGGVNTAILDNIRGIAFRPNKNLLVTVASGASQNTLQEFDTAGVRVGTFISGNLNSPFDILIRSNDILVSNSSGTNDVSKFSLTGTFISGFIANSNLNFAQALQKLPNGNITVCAFSGTGTGLHIYDSTGTFINNLTGVTGNRGSWRLPNGNFLVSNSGGVHEINGTTGALIRTIIVRSDFQFFGLYDPNILVGITPVQNGISSEYELFNNYPNPFNPETNIRYSIPKRDFVSIKIYNSIGKEVSSFVNKIQEAGVYEIKINADNLSSGVYYYKLVTNEFTKTQKMILLK